MRTYCYQHFVTDSPTSQYRNRSICTLVAKLPKLFGVTASWTWLEAGHGKGPCDGVGGGIKKKADKLVKSGRIISSNIECCQAIPENTTTMPLFEITAEEIENCKTSMDAWHMPPVTGIMGAHALIPATDMMIRTTSCLKSCCYSPGGVFHPTCQG